MNSVTSMSNASGLSVMSLAQAKSQNVLDNLTSRDQSFIGSADKSIVMKLSSSSFQTTVINALSSDTSTASGRLLDDAEYYAKYNSMSSDDISSMLYSGGGFQSGPSNDTFNSTMSMNLGADERAADRSGIFAWLAAGRPVDTVALAAVDSIRGSDLTSDQIETWTQGEYTREFAGWTDDQVTAWAESAQKDGKDTVAKDQQIMAAFANKTLTIQKASDVVGLDYQETMVFSKGNYGLYEQLDQSCNEEFARENTTKDGGTDGKNHAMVLMGPTMLWLTW